jgi:hypothetical protein
MLSPTQLVNWLLPWAAASGAAAVTHPSWLSTVLGVLMMAAAFRFMEMRRARP